LDTIIGLGANVFYGATLAACILIFRAKKPKQRKRKVLFIDASDQIRVGRAQNFLEAQHVETIYKWYREYKSLPDHVRVVDNEEIVTKEYNLNIPLYIEKTIVDNLPSMEEAIAELEIAAQAAWQAEDRFKELLMEFGLLS